MAILRIFRAMPQRTNPGETPEVKRILKRGPLDRPAGLSAPHSYMRSLDGRW